MHQKTSLSLTVSKENLLQLHSLTVSVTDAGVGVQPEAVSCLTGKRERNCTYFHD